MRDFDFNRHFDLDGMLNETASWLSVQISLPLKDFLKIADQLDLRQEDWDTFWKRTREAEKKEEKQEKNIECDIGEREYFFTQEEFEVAKQILNCPSPSEYSNCCFSQVYPHNANDHTSKCRGCGEGCGIRYEF